MKKIAIIGLSPTHDQAPWDDPDWELFGLALDPDVWRLDRVFEIHDIRLLKTYPDWQQYRSRMLDLEWVYVQHEVEEIPNGRAYPLAEVSKTTDYLCSSVAYMLALAIHEGATEIGIWGVDMAAWEEYGYQRANMEYLIGLARGKGIKVYVPAQSPLLKFRSDPDCKYRGRYGWLG